MKYLSNLVHSKLNRSAWELQKYLSSVQAQNWMPRKAQIFKTSARSSSKSESHCSFNFQSLLKSISYPNSILPRYRFFALSLFPTLKIELEPGAGRRWSKNLTLCPKNELFQVGQIKKSVRVWFLGILDLMDVKLFVRPIAVCRHLPLDGLHSRYATLCYLKCSKGTQLLTKELLCVPWNPIKELHAVLKEHKVQ